MIYTVTLNPSIDYIVHVNDIRLGELNKMEKELMLPGGKGINVSRILHRLGSSTTALGFLGGFTGDFIRQCLTAEQVPHLFTPIEKNTRINIKMKSREETEINGKGPVLSSQEVAHLKTQLQQVQKGDIVVFSGSIPPSLPTNFYNELIPIVKEKEAQFIVDTTKEDLLHALPYQPLLVKPNVHELAEMFDVVLHSVEEIITYGEKLRDLGAQHVLVSMGGDGALFITQDATYYSKAPKGSVKNSVGAGDSMIAGFISQYVQTENVVDAFALGVASGSATAFSDDLATKETIQTNLNKVTIQQIDQ